MTLPVLKAPTYKLTVPCTNEKISYRPWMVGEEKCLLIAIQSENQDEILTTVKNIIDTCTFNKLKIDELASFSIEYLFLKLRAKSRGEIIDLKHACIKCGHENELRIDVDKIEVEFNEKHSKKIVIKDDIGIMMKYPTISDIEKFGDGNNVNKIFDIMIECIDYIYNSENTYKAGDVTKEEMNTFVNSMNDAQFELVQNFFKTMPKLQKSIEYNCANPECDNKEPIILEGLSSFLG